MLVAGTILLTVTAVGLADLTVLAVLKAEDPVLGERLDAGGESLLGLVRMFTLRFCFFWKRGVDVRASEVRVGVTYL